MTVTVIKKFIMPRKGQSALVVGERQTLTDPKVIDYAVSRGYAIDDAKKDGVATAAAAKAEKSEPATPDDVTEPATSSEKATDDAPTEETEAPSFLGNRKSTRR